MRVLRPLPRILADCTYFGGLRKPIVYAKKEKPQYETVKDDFNGILLNEINEIIKKALNLPVFAGATDLANNSCEQL